LLEAKASQPLTESEVADSLATFENRHRLFELTVCEISVWRLIRFPVGFALQNLQLRPNPLPRRELLLVFFRSICELAIIRGPAHYAVKSYASALRLHGKSGYEDIYFEELLEKIPGGIRLHTMNARGYWKRRTTGVTATVDCTAILVIGALLARVFPVRNGWAAFEKIATLIKEELGVAGFPAARIRRMFSSFWWQSQLYTWLLRRLDVKTVLAADTGERPLLKACHATGAHFIELQHGIYTPDHPDALPLTALKETKESCLLLPDAIALYGEYWRMRLACSAMGASGRLFSAGASVIERYREIRRADFMPSPCCPRLVVTTQGIDREALATFLSQFLQIHRAPCRIIVKLHPAYDSSMSFYLHILGSDQRVHVASGLEDPNTYKLISESDVHLSIASACHYDALGIGTPTVVLGLPGYRLVQDLIDAGDALFAPDPEALAEIVRCRSWRAVDAATSGKYYRHGFVENMHSLMALS